MSDHQNQDFKDINIVFKDMTNLKVRVLSYETKENRLFISEIVEKEELDNASGSSKVYAFKLRDASFPLNTIAYIEHFIVIAMD